MQDVLTQVGLSPTDLQTFSRGNGIPGLTPFAEVFGQPMFRQLLARLPYAPPDYLSPPHTYESDAVAVAQLGIVDTVMFVAPRLLIAVPGYFRELSRRTLSARQAFVLESLGWLLVAILRDRVETATGKRWWVPPPPPYVAPIAVNDPGLTPLLHPLVQAVPGLLLTSGSAATDAQFAQWQTGRPGKMWQLEVGQAPQFAGTLILPMEQVVTPLPSVDLTKSKLLADPIWQQRVVDTQQQLPDDLAAQVASLTTCDPTPMPDTFYQTVSVGGLQIAYDFPALVGASRVLDLTVNSALVDTFAAVLTALFELGWNDLVFQSSGAACFRGEKVPPTVTDVQTQLHAARKMTTHGLGVAVDFNSVEAPQGTSGDMDWRVVALMEALRFTWGACFPTPDPMHFEYDG